ncbi:formin-like protein 5 [Penaeus monodon]|uniref:formin-like protein 5 n=1 Tax=Penaeus monodon TaxID=6687 RepID=UPI0018A77483|nr:formin-like protein 5 [Penaeus monodon]
MSFGTKKNRSPASACPSEAVRFSPYHNNGQRLWDPPPDPKTHRIHRSRQTLQRNPREIPTRILPPIQTAGSPEAERAPGNEPPKSPGQFRLKGPLPRFPKIHRDPEAPELQNPPESPPKSPKSPSGNPQRIPQTRTEASGAKSPDPPETPPPEPPEYPADDPPPKAESTGPKPLKPPLSPPPPWAGKLRGPGPRGPWGGFGPGIWSGGGSQGDIPGDQGVFSGLGGSVDPGGFGSGGGVWGFRWISGYFGGSGGFGGSVDLDQVEVLGGYPGFAPVYPDLFKIDSCLDLLFHLGPILYVFSLLCLS